MSRPTPRVRKRFAEELNRVFAPISLHMWSETTAGAAAPKIRVEVFRIRKDEWEVSVYDLAGLRNDRIILKDTPAWFCEAAERVYAHVATCSHRYGLQHVDFDPPGDKLSTLRLLVMDKKFDQGDYWRQLDDLIGEGASWKEICARLRYTVGVCDFLAIWQNEDVSGFRVRNGYIVPCNLTLTETVG